MSRDPSGQYTYPDGTRGTPGTTIFSARYNTFLDDLALTLNTALPINMGGTGATTPSAAITALGGVAKAGDTMTGNLKLNTTGGTSVLSLVKSTTGGVAAIASEVPPVGTNKFRWSLQLGNATTETGSGNVGSDFILYRFDDAGNVLSAALAINRATGNAVFSGAVKASGTFAPSTVDNAALALSGSYGGGLTFIDGANRGAIWTQAAGLALGTVASSTSVNPKLILNANDAHTITGTLTATNGRLWGATDGTPVWTNGVSNPVTTPISLNGNLNTWTQMIYNANTGGNAGCLYLQNGNDNSACLGIINSAGSAWKHVFYGNGNYTCNGTVTCTSSSTTGNASFQTGFVMGAATDARIYFYHNGGVTQKGALVYNGDDFYLSGVAGTSLGVNSAGLCSASRGYATKAGYSGAFSAQSFNIDWQGVAQLYIGATYQGNFAYTSDYRTKKDVADLHSTWDAVKELRPISYTQAEYNPPNAPADAPIMYKADDIERWGFLAHELQDTLIESAATAKKDAPEAIQSPNPWTIIAALTKALQEAMTRIEALEELAHLR